MMGKLGIADGNLVALLSRDELEAELEAIKDDLDDAIGIAEDLKDANDELRRDADAKLYAENVALRAQNEKLKEAFRRIGESYASALDRAIEAA